MEPQIRMGPRTRTSHEGSQGWGLAEGPHPPAIHGALGLWAGVEGHAHNTRVQAPPTPRSRVCKGCTQRAWLPSTKMAAPPPPCARCPQQTWPRSPPSPKMAAPLSPATRLPAANMAPPASPFRHTAALRLAEALASSLSDWPRRRKGWVLSARGAGMAAAAAGKGGRSRTVPRRGRVKPGPAAADHGGERRETGGVSGVGRGGPGGGAGSAGVGLYRGCGPRRGGARLPGGVPVPLPPPGASPVSPQRKDPFPGPAPLPRPRVKRFLRGTKEKAVRGGGGILGAPLGGSWEEEGGRGDLGGLGGGPPGCWGAPGRIGGEGEVLGGSWEDGVGGWG